MQITTSLYKLLYIDKFQGSNYNPNAVFGVPLDRLPAKNVGCNSYNPVPRYKPTMFSLFLNYACK